ncbi:MAG: DUF115 domain-containing protein, partial [Deltaproteobacteria bacterium]|nr:DUF115 domain-containing protein [Deltaproteobacteria bacterium]
NSLYIMAVDTALSPLLESHIIPDSIFALESQFYNLGDFYDSYGLNIDLITDITGYPPVCRKLTGIKYFFSSDFFDNKLLKRIDNTSRLSFKIPPLGSVGVAAVYSALKLFKSEIFLTGLDFAFVPGKSHSRGTPFSKALLRKSNRLNSINSYNLSMRRKIINRNGKIDNKTAQTDSVLESYAIILQDILSNEKRVYDITQEGIPLGIPIINKDEFIEKVIQNKGFNIKSIQPISQKEDLTGFLESEKNYLLKLINEWESFVDTKDDRIPISLMKSLLEVDYVYIDFPDRLPHPKKEISFISRAVTSARFYITHINKLLQ